MAGWGTSAGLTAKTTTNSQQVQQKMDNVGNVDALHTYGGIKETTEEGYSDSDDLTNEATNGQDGKSVITTHELIESNTDWKKYRRVKQEALPGSSGT